jgi:peptidoglycan/LPS O-acetylase OafA/YrhL
VQMFLPLNGFFSSPPFAFLGKISFPLYLVHFPIFCAISAPLYRRFTQAGFEDAKWLTFCIVLAICLAGALVFYQAEKTIRTYTRSR